MTGGKPVVAIVDDDRRMLESLQELLESAGYSVLPFLSAKSLLASRELALIDCLIADVEMPTLDGFELQKRVKETRPEVPVILITGRHEIIEQQRATGQVIFGKPFDAAPLLHAISLSLRSRKEESQ